MPGTGNVCQMRRANRAYSIAVRVESRDLGQENAPFPLRLGKRWLKARREDGRISGHPWPAAPTRFGRATGKGPRGARAGCCARDAAPRCSATPRESERRSGAPAELRTAQVLVLPGLRAATYFYPSPPASSGLASPPPTAPGCQSTPS